MKLGLRVKILAPILVVVILSMLLASLFSAQKAADQLRTEMLNSAQHQAQNLSKSLSIFVDDFQGMIALHAKNEKVIRVYSDRSPQALKEASDSLADFVKVFPAVQAGNILDSQGNVIIGSDPTAKGNFGDREYFKKAMKGQTNVSEPLLSRITNKPVFIVATPVHSGDDILGIVYLRIDLATFSDTMVSQVKVGENGYAFLADMSGLVFSHPDPSMALTFKIGDTDWGKYMLSKPYGLISHEFKGAQITSVFSREKSTNWLVVLTVDSSDIAKASGAVRNASLYASLAGIALVCVVIALIVGFLLKSLGQCVDFAVAVAGGDMEHDLKLHRTDQLGRLADSLRTMVSSLKDMIEAAKKHAAECAYQAEVAQTAMGEADAARQAAEHAKAEGMLQASQRLTTVVEAVTSATDALSAQIDESSQGAEHQSQRMGETATSMEEMSSTVLEVAKNAASASDTSDRAKDKAKNGAEAVGRVVESIARVQTQAQGLKRDMSALGQQVQDIGRIMNVITDIADQTNLLALNAAIEAARAGEAGRGFAVVADEVRKLAEKTMTATKEVGEAISGIQQGTKLNVDNVDLAGRTILEATELAGISGQALGEIVSLVENASDQVRSIATAAEEQSATCEEINRSIDQVNQISAETTQAMSQAAQAVADLSRQTQEMQTLIAEFQAEGQLLT